MAVRHVYVIGFAALLGCASSQPELTGRGAAPRSSSLLTAVDIATAKADVGSAYEAIARLRPNWLAPHGTMSSNPESNQYATVYLDGQQVGSIDALRRIQAYHVAAIRYYDITQAGARFGIRGGMGGVIEVATR